MKVLVIGAGAIGQAFGYHFQRGGAEVSFLVRPKYSEAARAGFALYPLNRRASEREVPIRFEGYGVFDDQDAAMAQPWDAVAVCVSSVAVRAGDWFTRLAASLGDATLITFLAGPTDVAFVREQVDADRWVSGMLSIVSYQAPLPEQSLPEEGVAFWIMPTGIGFSGTARGPIMETLKRGGMAVTAIDDAPTEIAFTGAVLDKTIIALEIAGWSFAALARDRALMRTSLRAMRETWTLAELRTGTKTPLTLRLLRPFMLRAVMRLSRYVLPLDLERFFAYHYTKVAAQTRHGVAAQLELFEEHGLAHEGCSELARRLDTQP